MADFSGDCRSQTFFEPGWKCSAHAWGQRKSDRGADTVFSQMVAETLHTDMEHVHIKTVQDTDVSPFDTGAYASRQSFVTGTAVRHCAEILRDKILAYAKTLLPEIDTRELTLKR